MSIAAIALGLFLAGVLALSGDPPVPANRFEDPEYVLQMALTDPDRDRRLLAASLLHSQPHLVRLMTSKEAEIRRLAVARLTDPATLAQAAHHDQDVDVRRGAVARARDEGVLREAALRDADARVGEIVVGRLKDVAALDAIASGARVATTRRQAAERATFFRAEAERREAYAMHAADRARLETLGDPVARALFVIGLPAARRDVLMHSVSDQATFEEIAKRTEDRALAQAARTSVLLLIRDPDDLLAAIFAAPPGMARDRAVERLGDEQLAQAAVRGDRDLAVLAASRIKKPEIARRVYDESRQAAVRSAVVWVFDREKLSMIAVSDRDPQVRQAARALSPVDWSIWLTQCKPPDVAAPRPSGEEREEDLLAVARSGAPAPERIAAIGRLTDQAALMALATTDPERDVRATAAAAVTHTEILKKMLASESDEVVRAAAVRRLTDPPTLASLARTDPSARVRRAALCNTRDRTLLVERARDEPDGAVRTLAQGLLDASGPLP